MDESAVPRLRIRGLDAGYGRVQVLFGLDLDVAPGEAVAVLGTNGAGKTTLLRASQRAADARPRARSRSTATTSAP